MRPRRPEPRGRAGESGALFDRSRRYRYRLWRIWDPTRPPVTFVLLNPSTADEHHDDPTMRRCAGFARRWGYGGIEVLNLFAWRSPAPAALRTAADPVGPRNDAVLREAVASAALVVFGWGNHARLLDRAENFLRRVRPRVRAFHLGLTASGQPRHPLYVAYTQPLIAWAVRGEGKS
jgi:hypothetical protein